MSYPVLTPQQLRKTASRLPRVPLAHLPTPLEEAPHFVKRLGGGPRVFIKRDDCTGLLFGGNKTRHNEFLMAEALRQQADVVVWGAGVQSNNCRQTAAACAKLGLECHLFLTKRTHSDDLQGNLLLDHIAGAHVHIVDVAMGNELDDLILAKAEEFRARGRRPFCWNRHTGRPLAAVSYALCVAEVMEDMARLGVKPAAVYSSSAGGTGAGLALGKKVLGLSCPFRLICPIRWPWNVCEDMAEVANGTAALLDLPHRLVAGDIDATEDYIGSGYGRVTPAGWEALELLAQTEGILLDPVYTSKAMAGLIDDVRKGRFKKDETIVFIHTGGQSALFAYRDEVLPFMKIKS
jgi:1-aminocyclopropane-1-carboxylate deaminase/D-cysteine desulfhydrase-like pyridoxal-dependent ACC family enzyme